jgi:hypothetical protein
MRRFLVDLIILSRLPERYMSDDSYPSTSRQATLGIANQLGEICADSGSDNVTIGVDCTGWTAPHEF